MAEENRDPFDFPEDPVAGADDLDYPDFGQPPERTPPSSFPPPSSMPPPSSPPSSTPPPSSFPPPGSSTPPPSAFPPPGSSTPPTQPPGYGAAIPTPTGAPPPGAAPGWASGMPPPYAAPQKKGRGCLFWAVLGLVLLVLLVGGCGIVGWLLIRGPIDGTNEFLAEVAAGDYEGAEALVAPGCTLDATQIEADLGGLTDYQILLASTGTGDVTRTGGTVTVDGDLQDFTAEMRDTDDGWRVCRYTFDELQIGG